MLGTDLEAHILAAGASHRAPSARSVSVLQHRILQRKAPGLGPSLSRTGAESGTTQRDHCVCFCHRCPVRVYYLRGGCFASWTGRLLSFCCFAGKQCDGLFFLPSPPPVAGCMESCENVTNTTYVFSRKHLKRYTESGVSPSRPFCL